MAAAELAAELAPSDGFFSALETSLGSFFGSGAARSLFGNRGGLGGALGGRGMRGGRGGRFGKGGEDGGEKGEGGRGGGGGEGGGGRSPTLDASIFPLRAAMVNLRLFELEE